MPTDASDSFARLFEIVRRLRAPDGCPWDREQTPETLRPGLVEETWEAVSAIDAGDDANLREELGDLFLMVTMISWMREQEGSFTVDEVLRGICEKLVRRHPHVFADSKASTTAEVLRQWDQIKAGEHASDAAPSAETLPSSALDHVARSLPPLERSLRLQKKAAKVGFDWPGPQPVWGKVQEELRELKDALEGGQARSVEEEAGDLLFSVVNLLRLLPVDPGVALHAANAKFERRFREMEQMLAAAGTSASEAGMERLDAAWNEVKASEARARKESGEAQDPAAGAGGAQSTSK